RANGGGDRGRPARAPGPVRSAARSGGATPRRRDAPPRREGPAPGAARSAERPRAVDVRPEHAGTAPADHRPPPDPWTPPSHRAGVRAGGDGPPGGLAGHVPGLGAATRRVSRFHGRPRMTRARLALARALVAGGLGACKTPPPPLPPVPSGSGGVLVRAGETPPVKDSQAVIDRVVAVVNGDVIMMSELQEAMALAHQD